MEDQYRRIYDCVILSTKGVNGVAIKEYKPTTPSRRGMTSQSFDELTCSKPEKSLLRSLHSMGGRNNYGRITVHHRGGGCKSLYRVIDFKRKGKDGVPAKVHSIQYDPNRSANIALLIYADGEKRYILAPLNLKVGDVIQAGENADIKVGNVLPLKNIPDGTIIHNIELKVGKGGQMARTAGTFAQLMGKDTGFAQIKLPSGEVRLVSLACRATIGQVGNVEHGKVKLGNAGRSRRLGRRPTTRGCVKNPVDHPHGGGEGKNSIGMKAPKTPWGKPALGKKTRKKKQSDNYIITKRNKK